MVLPMRSRLALFAVLVASTSVPASASAMASAELYSTKSYRYGRFDARIRFAPGDGVVSSFFLWKEGSDASNAYWNELDYEKIGANCSLQINSIYGNPETQHQQKPTVGFDPCGGYHDYRFEWTPSYIAWVVDGTELRRDTGANATAYAENATAGMSFHFNIWPGNASFGGNIDNTTLPVHEYISWVQYSSYSSNGGDSFNVEWREDFQGSAVPSGWAVGNWVSPYNLSTHNAKNVAFVNGIAVLSLTADNATGSPGTPPADPSADGTGGSAGTGGATSAGSGTGGAPGSGGASGGGNGSGGSGGGSSSSGGHGGATGSGGSAASGGQSGLGGVASSTGGSSTPTGGTWSGGSNGTAAGTGGGTAAGGNTASGGTTTATAATGGAAGGGAAGGGSAPSQAGCSCSSAGQARSLGPAALLLLAVLAMLATRRTHRRG